MECDESDGVIGWTSRGGKCGDGGGGPAAAAMVTGSKCGNITSVRCFAKMEMLKRNEMGRHTKKDLEGVAKVCFPCEGHKS